MTTQEQQAETADRIIRSPECLSMSGLTASARDRLVRDGKFPKPIKLIEGGRAVGWSWRAVQGWIADRIAAADRGAA